MLGMTRKPTPEPTDIDRLRDRMVLPQSANLLKLAEQIVTKLRADQRSAKERLTPLYDDLRQNSVSTTKDRIAEVEAELKAIEKPLQDAFVERDRRRQQFGEKARQDLGPVINEFSDAVNAKLDELDELFRLALGLHVAATISGIEMPRIIESSQTLAAHIHSMRRVLRGGF
ncbi:hypothetical protein ACFSOZ_16270 [Mesorhizobium newzealandense]|uniref:Chemotaxis protein n=1 Tax=Mesorhizobium newzealandense TaxID=1300302 RepID=A0ABW4UCA8_9HYPH